MTSTKELNGTLFSDMILGGAVNLKKNSKIVDELNVFPIPDGDTGNNMTLTISGGVSGISEDADTSIGRAARRVADGMLLGARGNSGVILSQFFEGMALGLKNVDSADVITFGDAMRNGVSQAYSSVVKPTEGTMLTVMREATEYALSKITRQSTFESYFEDYIKEMKESLQRTPELLDVLKEAGVIDSGGAGFVYIIEGMNQILNGERISEVELEAELAAKAGLSLPVSFGADSVLEYGYCTELLIQLMNYKTDVISFDVNTVIKYLESVGGDSIVAVKSGSVLKLHVHTMNPGPVLDYCRRFGEFITVKIENMSIQHSELAANSENKDINKDKDKSAYLQSKEPSKKARPAERKKYGVVAVASGDGIKATFLELGADYIVDGQQTMNPSTADFINAFDAVNAERIIVLPDNSNILMAASQAAELYDKSEIYVVPSKTVAEGYSALTMLDFSSDNIDTILDELNTAVACVTTGLVTYAVRDSRLDGFDIKTGDYLGFAGKKTVSVSPSKVEAACRLIDSIDMSEKEVIIAICGQDVTAGEMSEFRRYIREKYRSVELYEVDGGQDIYSFIFAV